MLLKFGIKKYHDDSVIITGEKLELWEGCLIFLCLIKFMKVNMKFMKVKSWNCGEWIYFLGVIKFMKGKVNVKFMKVKSWNCGEGIYFVGVIKFMDRLSAGV